MQTLKKIISRYMYELTLVLVVIMLVAVLFIQFINERQRTYENAIGTLHQIEQVLEENQEERTRIREEYSQSCLHRAEVIARIIEDNPDIQNDIEELKKIAVTTEVDEIHIFDASGRIFAGTHPQYYNYTFDSGEQMMFFKPMLTDKSLKLVQDITPNTAEGKLMQYSALWSRNGEFIVQVGMEPVKVTKVTEKNEMSYIFSLFRINLEADYYAGDAESGEIAGSTDLDTIGCNVADIGFQFDDIVNDENGFFAEVNGQYSFCVFMNIGTNYVGQIVPFQGMSERISVILFTLLICLSIASVALVNAVTKHMNEYVVEKIHEVNHKLNLITHGNLDEIVDVRSSVELSELSDYINGMVESLLDNNRKMSYVLKKTNLLIGIYEYNSHMDRVRFTEYIPQIFSVDSETMDRLSLDISRFKDFIKELYENPVSGDQGVYKAGEKYIKLEEIVSKDGIFGVAVDVTAEVKKRMEIEQERDIDSLTGLYNRRGLDAKLDELFAKPQELGFGALIVIDADGLKAVNDTYGHEKGDAYLKTLADVINNFGENECIASRQGGDEFVLFLYGYDSEEELVKTIGELEYIQNNSTADIGVGQEISLKFSFGVSLVEGDTDYQKLLREADEKMYQNKQERRDSE